MLVRRILGTPSRVEHRLSTQLRCQRILKFPKAPTTSPAARPNTRLSTGKRIADLRKSPAMALAPRTADGKLTRLIKSGKRHSLIFFIPELILHFSQTEAL